MGELSLRRRRLPDGGVEVFEAKLGEEFLMSSLFTTAEVELARLGLAAVRTPPAADSGLDVLVGGLGLGYTAAAALEDHRVSSLSVVEALPEVVRWHRGGLLPLSQGLVEDPRTRLVTADFFATVGAGVPLPGDATDRCYDAVLVDIDHTPRHVLAPGHAGFYSAAGVSRVRRLLTPGGVFALWSDDPPESGFTGLLEDEFGSAAAHVVEFDNPLTGGVSANTVYVAVSG